MAEDGWAPLSCSSVSDGRDKGTHAACAAYRWPSSRLPKSPVGGLVLVARLLRLVVLEEVGVLLERGGREDGVGPEVGAEEAVGALEGLEHGLPCTKENQAY